MNPNKDTVDAGTAAGAASASLPCKSPLIIVPSAFGDVRREAFM